MAKPPTQGCWRSGWGAVFTCSPRTLTHSPPTLLHRRLQILRVPAPRPVDPQPSWQHSRSPSRALVWEHRAAVGLDSLQETQASPPLA